MAGINITAIVGGTLFALLSVTALGLKLQTNKVEQLQLEAIAAEVRNQAQVQTIEQLTGSLEEQTEALRGVQIANQAIEADVRRYLDIFSRHDLSRLAAARPGMIELRVNNGTKEVFDAIQNDSNTLAELNTQ